MIVQRQLRLITFCNSEVVLLNYFLKQQNFLIYRNPLRRTEFHSLQISSFGIIYFINGLHPLEYIVGENKLKNYFNIKIF